MPSAAPGTPSAPAAYQASWVCRNCHIHQYEQYRESAHASSFSNPVFRAQYFGVVVPRLKEEPILEEEAARCIACHSPVASREVGRIIRAPEEVRDEVSGVTCDFCHTLEAYDGTRPGNGRVRARPGTRKFGPYRFAEDWHHVYSEFITQSEFCAVCHQARNAHGFEVKDTYREWLGSSFARRNIECQECHMNLNGFLMGGRAVYESGQAARRTINPVPQREVLYSHRFPGAHTLSQIEGALTLDIRIVGDAFHRGKSSVLIAVVDNERSGHKMPTGSADLRALVLVIRLSTETWQMAVPASSTAQYEAPLDLFGEGPFDKQDISRNLFPRGGRVYRAIWTDEAKRPTLASWDAVAVLFDNRLEAGEKRVENFSVPIPSGLQGDRVEVSAVLYYLPYPAYLSETLGAPEADPMIVAELRKEIPLH